MDRPRDGRLIGRARTANTALVRLGARPPGLVQPSGDNRSGFLHGIGGARSGPGRLLPFLLAILGFASPLPARSDEAVAVRAGIHPGFGRLVLEWPAPVEAEDRQEGSRYRLRFGRPHLGPHARELRLELAPGIAVRQAVQQRRIVVLDLAPAVASAAVEVRTWLHDGFGRVVFAWSQPTTFDAVCSQPGR